MSQTKSAAPPTAQHHVEDLLDEELVIDHQESHEKKHHGFQKQFLEKKLRLGKLLPLKKFYLKVYEYKKLEL